jgi:protein-S-isoprenylcysteine O-methyltransferase Ste14
MSAAPAQGAGLFRRALLAFLALPGLFAFGLPGLLVWREESGTWQPLGLLPLGIGAFLLAWCARDFYVAGKGTLAPWAPPRELVVVGLYRYSRNPMYLAVGLVLAGWAVCFGLRSLWVYTAAVMLAFHLRVVYAEEPWLARTHGEAWERYRARVPRWLL